MSGCIYSYHVSSCRRGHAWFLRCVGSPEWVQGAKSPGAGFRAAEALTFFPPALVYPLQKKY